MKRLRGTQISLNPFRAGQCLSTAIPDEVFQAFFRLNPFRTGQCLSTQPDCVICGKKVRLNPFRAGQCLSTLKWKKLVKLL